MLFARCIAILAAGVVGSSSWAQCAGSWQSLSPIAGVGGEVLSSTLWDRDGNGPEAPVLVLAGTFRSAGNILADGVVVYDPSQRRWSALGPLSQATSVVAMTDGTLAAIGKVGNATRLVRWTGTAWQLFPGTQSITISTNATPRLEVTPSGGLVLFGDLTAPSFQSYHIAKWNGSTWSFQAPRLAFNFASGVRSMVVLPDGDIVVGGDFSVSGSTSLQRLARWTGDEWVAMGALLQDSGTITGTSVETLKLLSNGELWIGGNFETVNGQPAGGLAKLVQDTWSAPAPGMAASSRVQSIHEHSDGSIYIGGSITYIFDVVYRITGGLARLRNQRWEELGTGIRQLGQGSSVRTMTSLQDGSLIVGGMLAEVSGVAVSNVARFDGTAWSALSEGINARARAIAPMPDGGAVVAGDFTSIDGVSANGIARWNGSVWQPLGPGVRDVYALAVQPDGGIIAAGTFRDINGLPASRIARWEGANWMRLDDGLRFTNPNTGTAGVWALLSLPNGEVIAGGSFDTAGNVPARNIAIWRNLAWEAMGDGLPEQVTSVATLSDGSIIASGSFPGRVARWDGARWITIPGTGPDGVVVDVEPLPSGGFVAVGSFSRVNSIVMPGVAVWSGDWQPLGAGVGTCVTDVVRLPDGDILVTGDACLSAGATRNATMLRFDTRTSSWTNVEGSPVGTINAAALLSDGRALVVGDFQEQGFQVAARVAVYTPPVDCACDSIDFNNDQVFPDPLDLTQFLGALQGSLTCATCNDVDFNNNGVFPEDQDVISFFNVLAGGTCE